MMLINSTFFVGGFVGAGTTNGTKMYKFAKLTI